jgi:hypothetical protein
MPTIDVTLKTVQFKPGRAEQPGAVAQVVLMCDEPDQVIELVGYISQRLRIDASPLQQELPFEEPSANGTVAVSAGRRRRGTKATPTEDE